LPMMLAERTMKVIEFGKVANVDLCFQLIT
jgi:hypothetical protein